MQMIDTVEKKITSQFFDKIAIAIKMSDRDRNQRHLGIFLKSESTATTKLLHLAWHNDLRLDEDFDGGYHCIQACKGLMSDQVESFVDWLELLWENNKTGIPYGLIFDENEMIFGSSGEKNELKPGQGLTCSSFVLECFKCFGLDLIKYNTWPVREEDKDWAEGIFYFLEKKADPEHIDAQRSISKVTRFRPEEVAAAASLGDFSINTPLSFCDIEPLSIRIAQQVS